VLAENAFKEQDLVGAVEHYEAAVQAYAMWPEGWFNAALLYEALGDYEYAANRMRHYLELAPDAPDARAARDKVIVWDDKARR
jgi:predicted TPR repeat methyltransferase